MTLSLQNIRKEMTADMRFHPTLNDPLPDIQQLDMVTKPTNVHTCIKLSYVINLVFLLPVPATLGVLQRMDINIHPL
jgi:hypothetical protein